MPQQFKSSILVELEFGDVGFYGGRETQRETEEPKEKPMVQVENQLQNQPTDGTSIGVQAGGGCRSTSHRKF